MLNPVEIIHLLVSVVAFQPSQEMPVNSAQAEAAPEMSAPFGYEAYDAENRLDGRTSFAFNPSPTGAPGTVVWTATRVSFRSDGTRVVSTASSVDCPRILYVLERFAALDVGGYHVLGISPALLSLGPQTRDGHTYRFWGAGVAGDGAQTRLTVQGSAGDVGSLGQLADFQLESCWSPQASGS